jgi:hypothetical protein
VLGAVLVLPVVLVLGVTNCYLEVAGIINCAANSNLDVSTPVIGGPEVARVMGAAPSDEYFVL